jgi:hypothetical protein
VGADGQEIYVRGAVQGVRGGNGEVEGTLNVTATPESVATAAAAPAAASLVAERLDGVEA